MRNALLFLTLAVCPLIGADSQFNGRWDITVRNEPRNRAWWLQVEGAGTPNIKGKFVGFPGGNMNDIQKIWIKDGELHFTFDRAPLPGKKGGKIHQEYAARLVGDKLEGTFADGKQKLTWSGMRAPKITDKDDGSWREGKPIRIFDGKDLSGWHGQVAGKQLGWSVKDGILSSTGGANNLESDQKFWNFKLHLEFRVGSHSNSGIGLRGRYEAQIMDAPGRPIDIHSMGALYSRIPPSVDASKPAGQWQTYDIRLVGRQVTLVLNGQKVVQGEIEGLTAVAAGDPNEALPGPLVLQGDHGPVDFRNVVLTPLVR